jgi:bifunctional DNase/RNase
MEREFRIRGLMIEPITKSPIVILQDVEGKTLLPIWMGIFEANAIALELHGVESQRPMTHDLLKNLIHHFDADVAKVVVTELKENTLFAQIQLTHNKNRMTIDSRPSDAIALAMRTNSPIFVADEVIQNSRNITLDPAPENLDPEEVRKWLENLSPEDLGKYKM